MESRKIGSNGNADMEKQTCGHSGGGRGWDELGDQDLHVCTTYQDSQVTLMVKNPTASAGDLR